jgi:hypothetical protein
MHVSCIASELEPHMLIAHFYVMSLRHRQLRCQTIRTLQSKTAFTGASVDTCEPFSLPD